MACSKFEYVKFYESQEKLLPSTYIVIRIDGKGFTKFTTQHKFEKPNDIRGIGLMNKAAQNVMQTFAEIWLAYGQSDEYSFVLRRNSQLYNRRSDKIATTIASCFTAGYVMFFKEFFPGEELQELPMFDGRCVLYPTNEILRDYFNWRQADCHINNLYNTIFWSLVQNGGQTMEEAHKTLKGTDSAAKNEMLFTKFNINYAKIDPIWRKGTTILRIPREILESENNVTENEVKNNTEDNVEETKQDIKENKKKGKKTGKEDLGKSKEPRKKWDIIVVHDDIISDTFWEKYKESLLL